MMFVEVNFEEFIVYVAFEILCNVNQLLVVSQMV